MTRTRKTWMLVAALAVRVGVLASAPVRADRDIVFSAQWYRLSGYSDRSTGEKTLDDKGPYHLYRINPDGTGLKQLTKGPHDDLMPRWSPDGKRILFQRGDEEDSRVSLCLVDPRTKRVNRILSLRDGPIGYAWSPDGKWISVLTDGSLTLLHLSSGNRQALRYGYQFAWSPDSKRLFVSFATGAHRVPRCEVRSVSATGTTPKLKIASPIWNPHWINSDTLVGIMPGEPGGGWEKDELRVISAEGKELRRIKLQPQEGSSLQYSTQQRRWVNLNSTGTKFVVETRHGRSDGPVFAFNTVNLKDGRAALLRDGMFLGLSADRTRIASADDSNWVGPYKRGGRRCGPLEILDLRTGRSRAITGRLVHVYGGDWRKSR
jgi:hypothetical protein